MSDQFKRYEVPWAGWGWAYGMYLVDPEGNRYSQEMIRSSFFTLQLKHELVGSELKVLSLKGELERRIDSYKPPKVVVYWGDGEETILSRHY